MSIIQNGSTTSSNFNKEFGAATERKSNTTQGNGGNNREPQPKSQYWLNVGVLTIVQGQDGETVEHFTALPQGIPLDTMKKLEVKGTADYRARLTAQNDLLDAVLKKAESIAPGETKLFTLNQTGLAVQIRRAKADEAPIPADQNQYTVDLGL